MPVCSCTLLDLLDLVEGVVEHAGEPPVHVRVWLVETRVDDQRSPAVALEEGDELVLGNAREHGRVRNLVAVQVEDRQDGTVDDRVQELVRMPARRERSRLGLAVTDDAGDDEIGIVEGRSECMRQRIAELTPLVDRARRLRRDMGGDAARERELPEERPQPVLAEADVRVPLGVGAFEVRVCDKTWPAVARAGDEDHRQVARGDCAVQVGVEEVQPWGGAEVSEQARFDVLGAQRLAQQRIVEQIDLSDREIVGGAPVRVDELELCRGRAFDAHRHRSNTKRGDPP